MTALFAPPPSVRASPSQTAAASAAIQLVHHFVGRQLVRARCHEQAPFSSNLQAGERHDAAPIYSRSPPSRGCGSTAHYHNTRCSRRGRSRVWGFVDIQPFFSPTHGCYPHGISIEYVSINNQSQRAKWPAPGTSKSAGHCGDEHRRALRQFL